jgi:hypothetical protein
MPQHLESDYDQRREQHEAKAGQLNYEHGRRNEGHQSR